MSTVERPRCVECGRFVPRSLRDRFPQYDLVCTSCVDDGAWTDTVQEWDNDDA